MQAIAEVVSSSVTSVIAQVQATESAGGSKVGLGSFIRIESESDQNAVIAVVYDVVTEPLDGVHQTSAFGLTREQLRREQPQIFSLLRTSLHATVVGFIQDGKSVQHLPSQPAGVHDFVYPASESEIKSLTNDFEFLRLLLAVSVVPADELLAAAVREASKAHADHSDYSLKAGRAFSQLFRSDYDRLLSILRKIRD